MANEFKQTLIPAIVSFNVDGSEVKITDYNLTLSFDNGTSYQENVDKTGKRSYLLQKGNQIEKSGNVSISITKTPDGQYDSSISTVGKAIEDAQKNDKPDQYNKSLAFAFSNAGDKNFMNISFSGHAKEFKINIPEGTQFPVYNADIVVADPATVQVSK